MKDKQRIIDLQKQVRIARTALEHIVHGHAGGRDAYTIAEQALDDMQPKDRPVPLEGLLGWSKRP